MSVTDTRLQDPSTSPANPPLPTGAELKQGMPLAAPSLGTWLAPLQAVQTLSIGSPNPLDDWQPKPSRLAERTRGSEKEEEEEDHLPSSLHNYEMGTGNIFFN